MYRNLAAQLKLVAEFINESVNSFAEGEVIGLSSYIKRSQYVLSEAFRIAERAEEEEQAKLEQFERDKFEEEYETRRQKIFDEMFPKHKEEVESVCSKLKQARIDLASK